MKDLSKVFNSIQQWFFPILEEEIGKLTEKQRYFARIMDLVNPAIFTAPVLWYGTEGPTESRMTIFKKGNCKTFTINPNLILRKRINNCTIVLEEDCNGIDCGYIAFRCSQCKNRCNIG